MTTNRHDTESNSTSCMKRISVQTGHHNLSKTMFLLVVFVCELCVCVCFLFLFVFYLIQLDRQEMHKNIPPLKLASSLACQHTETKGIVFWLVA